MDPERVVVRKYENRRLYDTANSRYVNLDDIAQMVREGRDIQVVDAASGEDLTRVVLTQIIVENAKDQDSGFPVDLLRQMIMVSGNAGKESLIKYMQTLAAMYDNAYRAFAPGIAGLNFFRSPVPEREPEAPRTGAANGPSVEELHRRVEELERLVNSRAAKQPESRTKKTAPVPKARSRN
ncbi:MAG: polyhydroxyalkanoate synthesis regulator DNA-binding domain-containing protein [Acidobacteriaceae bacterium]|nr:polyhydroxyalkanoate synthesis regulator DNA-binding domain-containing protein [Acidobacteriaceae bacterium]